MQLFEAAVSGVNVIPTVLLLLVIVYWILVIVGVVDVDSFDIDVDADIDADVDVDAASVDWLNNVLAFFNLAHIPLMVFASFFALPLWFISIAVNHYFFNESILMSWLFLIPNIIASLFIAKILTYPFVGVFKALNHHPSEGTAVGQVCTIQIAASSDKTGQAAVAIDKGAPLLLQVRTQSGVTLEKGKKALVIQYDPNNKTYLIEPFEL